MRIDASNTDSCMVLVSSAWVYRDILWNLIMIKTYESKNCSTLTAMSVVRGCATAADEPYDAETYCPSDSTPKTITVDGISYSYNGCLCDKDGCNGGTAITALTPLLLVSGKAKLCVCQPEIEPFSYLMQVQFPTWVYVFYYKSTAWFPYRSANKASPPRYYIGTTAACDK